MIIHHTGGLHERVTDRRSYKLETAFLEVLAHRIGFYGLGWDLLQRLPSVHPGLATHELPDVSIEAAGLFLYREKCFGILYCRFNLQPVAHDAGVVQ